MTTDTATIILDRDGCGSVIVVVGVLEGLGTGEAACWWYRDTVTTHRLTIHIIATQIHYIRTHNKFMHVNLINIERVLTYSHSTKPNLRRSGWWFQGSIASLIEYSKTVVSCSWCSDALVTMGGVG